ncbi:hypothetical protein PseBG33_2239 [Pseudomonas synxantha BG33R]|nr:hypothetical protein PseBG33_2239 [Pseudomonas synxantha BG33R]
MHLFKLDVNDIAQDLKTSTAFHQEPTSSGTDGVAYAKHDDCCNQRHLSVSR